MARRLFFKEFEVMRSKRRYNGIDLPSDGILVKLRKPGQEPTWQYVNREKFRRERHFQER